MRLEDAKELIINNYPEFTNAIFKENTKGWSNYVVLVDDRILFRFPRNAESQRQLNLEQDLLSSFKKSSNVSVPEFKYISNDPNKSFVGYEYIEGNELESQLLTLLNKSECKNIARQIGLFLSKLHSHHTKVTYAIRRLDKTWDLLEERLTNLPSKFLNDKDKKTIAALFKSFRDLSSSSISKLCLIHGDFTSDHILLSAHNLISGIIDFGDISIGDPAFDFAGLYLSYGKDFMTLVLSYYELPVDDNFLMRIESFYIHQVYFHDLLHGIENNDEALVDDAIRAIRGIL